MIYLDNNATTPVDPRVLDAMLPYLSEEFGNPSSKYYTLATNAQKAVDHAREQVAALIEADPKEIIFTSGASESNNLVIKGIADYHKHYLGKGNHLLTSTVEHKSVLQTFKYLNGEIHRNKKSKKKVDRGFTVDFIPVDSQGHLRDDLLQELISEETILGSTIWANNEIGTINDLEKIGLIFKENDIFFHSDATQLLGKTNIDVKSLPVDALSFSAHKLYGPKGIGALYLKKNGYRSTELTALIHGGDQEFGYRAGTHNVHNIVGFGKAAEIAKQEMDHYISQLREYELKMKSILVDCFPNIQFIGDQNQRIPGTISFVLEDQHNELFIKKFADQIAFSSGSACSITDPSHVLTGIGMQDQQTHFFRIALNKYQLNNQFLEEVSSILSNAAGRT